MSTFDLWGEGLGILQYSAEKVIVIKHKSHLNCRTTECTVHTDYWAELQNPLGNLKHVQSSVLSDTSLMFVNMWTCCEMYHLTPWLCSLQQCTQDRTIKQERKVDTWPPKLALPCTESGIHLQSRPTLCTLSFVASPPGSGRWEEGFGTPQWPASACCNSIDK